MTTMSGFNWIADLSPETRHALLAKARTRAFADGTTIYRQGDPVIDVFQIVSGEIRHCILTEDGQEVLIYIYQPGDLVGDSSVSDGDPSPVTVISRGPVELRAWSAKDFSEILAAHPEAASAVSAQLSRRLRGALRLLEENLTQPVPARVASRFLWLCDARGGSHESDLALSQADIALMVGSTRQSVNRVVTELRHLKLIETDYGKVTVKDPEGLRRYISEHQRLARASQ
ncbi:Crp/Fnr family transcriptional regulator [Pseudomonas sp. GD03869]|uniref:Crp/Fnr family transcriptional regulator n=2 Tax=Pseudomonas TaxID=286 RepID=UPI00244B2B5D|nr:Crp/Fnr family transcriptional regulator [Pseudomonas sp. GD03869]MDH0605167.1 Crp/Fnr family transcriptional regulator [Pseudomonas sp. GD03869]